MREVVLPDGRIRRYRSAEEIAEIVQRFRSSNVSAAKFAAENGVHIAVLRRWLKMEGAEAGGAPEAGRGGPTFHEVKLPGDSGVGWSAELIAPSGLVVRFSGLASREFMANLCQLVLR